MRSARLMALLSATAAAPALGQAATPTPVHANTPTAEQQPAADPGRPARQSYDAAFFQQYAASNALQMVQRVPGFSLDEGDQEVRGFSQAAGNVVIDGQRPASKSEGLDDVLARIPASRVVRIEVGPGDQFGSEYTGKAQVANVVLAAGGGLSGTAEGSVSRVFTGDWRYNGNLSGVLKRGASSFTLAVAADDDGVPEEGFDRITALPSGAQTEFRKKFNDVNDITQSVSAAWEYNGGTNKTAHLNGRYLLDLFTLVQFNTVTPSVGAVRNDSLSQRYDTENWEIGGDVTRPFAGGGLKLLGLVTRSERNNSDLSLIRPGGVLASGFAQILRDNRDESLVRLTWARSGWNGWSVELGAEGTLNRLVSDVDLASFNASGARTPIDLPIDNAVVKEYRGEAFARAGREIAPKLRVDGGLTYEASRLTVSGDASAKRTLKFLKPKVSVDWQLPDVHAQLSIERTVAQLRFEDFISAAELTNDRVNGGNANLLPQRAWEARLTLQRPFLGDGLFKLELGWNQISLVQDRVPTPDGFDAPGNLGSGRSLIWRGTIDAPLGKLGIKGGRLTLYGSVVHSNVRDPYTGLGRYFSGNSLAYWSADYRQDLGQFAYGIHLEAASTGTVYRLNELDSFRGLQPYSTAFAEYRPSRATSVQVGVRNAFDVRGSRFRTFFAPNRSNPRPNLYEERQRNQHVTPYLTVKHSFG